MESTVICICHVRYINHTGGGGGGHMQSVQIDQGMLGGILFLYIPTSVNNEQLSSLKPAARAFFRENSTETKWVLLIYKHAQIK